ncbi:periplasmic binding protein [Mycolicibacterium thermoresistibile ATCC 19527]|uniref:Periplasmic binding protein n=1 Tax=Mycolicibacterium thermoresistibile (strain ATCC 19527 / DSM 44167 / CIP 105390 / JCM 6362 / NCTC 10409 / 316) TaxID=1078020 RepID=G7CEL9_MYCT3|nr:periplasmic binding protein [Mycolicibacterium thermoresistibile ATCC 19527]
MIAGMVSLVTAVFLTMATGCGAPQGAEPAPPRETVITSTTEIAGAGVLGNQRRPDESCAAEPAAPDPGPPVRDVAHAAGSTAVPADPQRIVVLSGDQLDALCALGLQSRIVAAAVPEDTGVQPAYLGTVIHELPAAGTRTEPDLDAIRAARPDLILGSQALTPADYPRLAAIAPTVFTGAPGPDWQGNLRTVGAATGRSAAADALLDGFAEDARRTGAQNDAAHFQASVVQLTDTTVRVFGADTFPGSVLAAVGLDRPAAQRFTDRPYIDIGATDAELADADFGIAEGDIVYVSFASPAARDRARTVFTSDAWRRLSATKDNRVFTVNNEVWQTGQNIVAARGILDDLQWVNAPIN